MYKFMQDVNSLATGKTHRKGEIVPPNFVISDFLIKSGAIKEIKDKVADKPEKKVEKELPIDKKKIDKPDKQE
jgi:hypothetical protein